VEVNGKERYAAAVVIVTLALGVLAGALERGDEPDLARRDCRNPDRPDSADNGCFRRLDLNRATRQELILLPGIGPKRAEAIIRWRSEHGRFDRVERLLEVKGLGPVTLERIREYVCIDSADT
jgi:competence ComEA-like helix-hairpin-helix protein